MSRIGSSAKKIRIAACSQGGKIARTSPAGGATSIASWQLLGKLAAASDPGWSRINTASDSLAISQISGERISAIISTTACQSVRTISAMSRAKQRAEQHPQPQHQRNSAARISTPRQPSRLQPNILLVDAAGERNRDQPDREKSQHFG